MDKIFVFLLKDEDEEDDNDDDDDGRKKLLFRVKVMNHFQWMIRMRRRKRNNHIYIFSLEKVNGR